MDKFRCFLVRCNPRRVNPAKGHALSDAAVVAVCVMEVIKEAATIIAPVVVLVVWAVIWMIEES